MVLLVGSIFVGVLHCRLHAAVDRWVICTDYNNITGCSCIIKVLTEFSGGKLMDDWSVHLVCLLPLLKWSLLGMGGVIFRRVRYLSCRN